MKALGWVPSIVLDFGTATTLDVQTTHDGRYSGGIIALWSEPLGEGAGGGRPRTCRAVALARPAQGAGPHIRWTPCSPVCSGAIWGSSERAEVQRLSAELSNEIAPVASLSN